MRPTLLLALVVAACSTGARDRPPPVSPATGVHTSGPSTQDPSRIGATNPAQSFTPKTTPRARATALRALWTTRVGATSAATTMAVVGRSLYVSTDGGEGVFVLDVGTGALQRKIATSGRALGGFAIDGTRLFVTADDGSVLAASLDGSPVFRVSLGAPIASAPTLLDVTGDGAVDVIVGDARGNVTALEGKTGKTVWQRNVGSVGANGAGAASLVDVDGDGKDDVIVGSGSGALSALRGSDGAVLFTVPGSSPLRAPPVIVDVDGDGKEEIVATWSDARVAIVGRDGKLRWSAHVEEDDGAADGLVGAAVPVPSPRNGVLVVPTARYGARDGVVLLGEQLRSFRAQEGRVTGTPVVARVETEELPSALVGTEAGALVGFDALGNRTPLVSMGAPVRASLLLADSNGDGLLELFAVTADGTLACYLTAVPAPALLPRFRGASLHNDGRMSAVTLPWRLNP